MKALFLDGMIPFGKPEDWNDDKNGPCDALPVMVTGSVCTSVWEFSAQERRDIANGQNLTLTCSGGQPPVFLTVAPISDGPPSPITEPAPINWYGFASLVFALIAGSFLLTWFLTI